MQAQVVMCAAAEPHARTDVSVPPEPASSIPARHCPAQPRAGAAGIYIYLYDARAARTHAQTTQSTEAHLTEGQDSTYSNILVSVTKEMKVGNVVP